ncbi:WRKY family transcription factor family protein [Rhynchospora pubera]|uniref:WRKY family transcription factor family protein n=1 Tax=Rhynchospora pubera TaxID=906938 RepID=A0AAV8F7Y3_9POAL|nr:WRKY family transcription factor family protein [Rhynchospora pubera]KAJ4807587.1 WRKY family transcription factor family protein [Rhynchospora pubera]
MQEDAEKIVVAKPVASRPFSNNRPVTFSDSSVAIKPRTIRLRPKQNLLCPPTMDEMSESVSFGFSDKTSSKEGSNLPILYRPTPKLVSRRSVSLSANLEITASTQQQRATDQPVSSQNPESDQQNYYLQTRSAPKYYCSTTSQPPTGNTSQITDPSTLVTQNTEQETSLQTANSGSADRPSYDGYNWRKYGQKQVKGSEFPRSYYKCTHPNCPVKKKVERTLDGHIAEIVYKGEHNHPKPQPMKRQQQNSTASGNSAFGGNGVGIGNVNTFEPRMDGQDEFSLAGFGSCYQGQDGNITSVSEFGGMTASADFDRPDFKRRKKDDQVSGGSTFARSGDVAIAVQASMETDVAGDGFHWRKYGQKVVKGNPYPRSYYRCTSPKCNVRKYVEKVSDELGSFVTTYEGRHNHEAPSRRTSSAIS